MYNECDKHQRVYTQGFINPQLRNTTERIYSRLGPTLISLLSPALLFTTLPPDDQNIIRTVDCAWLTVQYAVNSEHPNLVIVQLVRGRSCRVYIIVRRHIVPVNCFRNGTTLPRCDALHRTVTPPQSRSQRQRRHI